MAELESDCLACRRVLRILFKGDGYLYTLERSELSEVTSFKLPIIYIPVCIAPLNFGD